ncbi:hypothetical protein QBC34DRAFT_452464 [Podospora aff. communis PSN243]|uniref:Uncharacterized protein n=1 Tax=Podospora aff. communis PSN243 TaxID=3040156 RepID=A0AAV9G5V9_9PEZI|nr:hypothetical protein QBC34DRAFT_452464 [Podospora aff. communis PSN243]
MSASDHLSPTSDGTTTTIISQTHSTLEVAPGRDYDKEALPVPYIAGQGLGGGIWAGAGPQEEAKILGLKRRTFFILAWIGSIVVAVAASVGGSLGATMGNRTCGVATNEGTATAQVSTALSASTRLPTPGVPSDTNTPSSETTLSSTAVLTIFTTPPTTRTGSASTLTTNTASVKIGGIGGRCSNNWGGDCICLDKDVCRTKWKGTPYTGTPDNWPCPKDPDNIMACVVKPCLGKSEPSQCLWKETCRELNPDSAPICPGEGDFICCAHSW